MLKDIKIEELRLVPKDITRFKRRLRKRLEKQLKLDKANGDISKANKQSLVRVTSTYNILNKSNNSEEIKEQILNLASIIEDNPQASIRIEGKTEAYGRYDYYKELEIKVDSYEFAEEILEDNIIVLAKQFVSKCIFKKNWDKWTRPDCNVMQLFKDGKISWDDVLERHSEACGI